MNPSASLRALVLARRRRWLAARAVECALVGGGVAGVTLAAARLSGAPTPTPRVVNRGIGGTGNLRFSLSIVPTYWDFLNNGWIITPTADCLIAPGYIATAFFYGFAIDGDEDDISPFWTGDTDLPLFHCGKKTATPSVIL